MREWLGFLISLALSPLSILDDCRLNRRYKRTQARQRELELDLAEGE